jgi:hypothetical protein
MPWGSDRIGSCDTMVWIIAIIRYSDICTLNIVSSLFEELDEHPPTKGPTPSPRRI